MPRQFDNQLSGAVIGAAIKVHRELGPGLDEPTYEEALSAQLFLDGVQHHSQWPVPLTYKGTRLDCGYRPDIFIPNKLIVELKSVEAIHPVHEAQLLTYLRLTEIELGLLINFDVPALKDGIRRLVLDRNSEIHSTRFVATKDTISKENSLDPITCDIIAAALDVHAILGPGLLPSAYEACVCHELTSRKIQFALNEPLSLQLGDVQLEHSAILPLLVAGEVPVICMASKQLTNLDTTRLIGRLRQAQLRRGLLLNFNVLNLRDGIRRVVNPAFAL